MPLQDYFKSQGWRRRGLAMLLGICATAALPPVYLLPLLIPAFAGLFLLVQNASTRRQAFLDGWWWGLGHFTSGLYWICISLWVDPERFAWLTPFALFGLPAVLAIYTGLVTLVLFYIASRWRISGGRQIVCFAMLWVGTEYLRAHLFTGFPWNLIGYVWTASDVTLQFASVVGVYGLSWITVLAATMPALFLYENGTNARRPNVAALCLLLALAFFGVWRLETHPTRYTDVKVRIVQANVAQNLKWDSKAALEGLRKYVKLTQSAGLDSVKLVLWPETAIPYYVVSGTALTQDMGSILPPGALLIAGGLRGNGYSHTEAWNSVFVIDGGGNVVEEYDKHHLVPFGEYVPLRGVWPVGAIAQAFAPGMGDFSRGSGPRTIPIDPYPPFSTLICYEAIFPGEATDGTGRARWLLSVTDDAWFGVSTGPYQDVEMARVRAVEHGLPLLRAANTGVSGAFDAYGRSLFTLPLESEGIHDLYLPTGEAQGAVFGRYPEISILFIVIAGAVFMVLL